MTDLPQITIGITCFNAEDTVTRAIESACAQDWPNLEIIIVDDVSADRSIDLVREAIIDEPRARLIAHERNIGPAGARNTIIEAASGKFVMFIDDDDIAAPERARRQFETINDLEKKIGDIPIACFASGRRKYDNGYTVTIEAIGSRGRDVPHGPQVANYLLFWEKTPDFFYGGGTPSCALMARTSTLRDIGGFDADLRRVEDADIAIRLALQGGYFVGTRDILYTQTATSAPDKSPEKNLESEQKIVLKHRDYLTQLGRFEYAYRWPRLRYWHFRRRYARFALELLGLLVRYPIAATSHLLSTGPRRLSHERRMKTRG